MPKVVNKVRKHRKFLSLTEKLELVAFFKQQKCSIRKLAKHFNIGKTQAGDIIRNQHKYYELFNSEGKECPGLGGPETVGFQIDRRVHEWYVETKKETLAITGPAIQLKALEIAKSLGNANFKASGGWLRRFQLRHNIALKPKARTEGEPDTDSKNLDEWKIQLGSLLSGYSPDDVYCADETGLFFQDFPDQTVSLKDETCSCGKFSSQRLTVLLCASMTGMKECPLVITSVPMDKVDFDPDSVQCNLESNSLSWMTRSIMIKWLEEFDQRMVEQKRKIILFLKRTPAHYSPPLKNIKVVHFPKNFYAESQPMNHGIVQIFKIHYRHLMLERFVMPKFSRDDESSFEDIDVSKAVSWIKDAWENVNICVIQRSFKSSDFECFTPDTINSSDNNKATLNDVAELLYACDSDVSATDYVNIDANLTTEGDDAEFIDILLDSDQIGDSFVDINNVMPTEESSDETPTINSYSSALRNLKELQRFYLSRNDHDSMSLVGQLIMHNEDINDCIINNGEDC